MPTLISNLLPRRGRKNTRDSNLDSVWGDFSITSPTDTVQMWPAEKPKLEVHVDSTERKSSTDDEPLTAIDIYTSIMMSKLEDHRQSSYPAPVASPLQSPVRSSPPFQVHSAPRSDLLGPEKAQSQPQPQLQPQPQPQALLQPQPQPQSQIDRSNSQLSFNTRLANEYNYLDSIPRYSAASTVKYGMISPATTIDEVFDRSRLASPTASERSVKMTSIYNDLPLSPMCGTTFVTRPKQSTTPPQESPSTNIQTQYASLNAAADTSVAPRVSALSPMCEFFSISEENAGEDGITVVDSTGYTEVVKSPRTVPPTPPYYQKSLAIDVTTNQSSRQTLTNQSTKPTQFISATSYLPCSPQSRRVPSDSELQETLRSVNEPSASVANPGIKKNELPQVQTSLPLRSPSSKPANFGPRSPTSPTGQVTVQSMKLKSPPLGVTGRMRVKPSPLTDTNHVPAGPTATFTAARPITHSRDSSITSIESVETPKCSYPVAKKLPMFPRQRSSSLEPPASPAFPSPAFPSPAFSYVKTPTAMIGPSVHRRQQSDGNGERNYASIDQVSNRSLEPVSYTPARSHFQPPPPPQQQQNYHDPAVFSKRLRSQVPLESPDFRKRQAFSNSPLLEVEPGYKKAAADTFYDEVRNDFRMVSRDAQAVIRDAQLAKSLKAAEDQKRRTESRSRSASRSTDSSSRRPSEDVPPVPKRNPTLVPCYRDMWE